jgi:hypothetical protein
MQKSSRRIKWKLRTGIDNPEREMFIISIKERVKYNEGGCNRV